MLNKKNWINGFLILVFVITSIFPAAIAYADEDDQEEYYQEEYSEEDTETVTNTDAGSDLGGYKGLVAHWKFDGNLTDETQFNNDGEAIGGKEGITYVDSVFGKGVQLDGKSYIEVKDSPSLDLNNEFTFSFWVYKDDMRKKDRIDGGVPYVIKQDSESEFPYGVYEWWDLTPGVVFTDENGPDDIHSEKKVDLQRWTMITATYDGQTMKIYKNNELVKSELKSVTLKSSTTPLYIGFGHFMTVDNYFKGVLDDMKIYNKAITYSEVEDLYEEALKGSGKKLIEIPKKMVAHYKFQNNLKDSSSFKNNGVAIKASNFKYVKGAVGKGIKFNGSSYIEVKDSDSLDLDKGFTFGMWVYREKSKKEQRSIFAKYGNSIDKQDVAYALQDWDRPILSLSDFDESYIEEFDSYEDKYTPTGKWFYYTATYNGDTLKLYINGKLIKSQEYSADVSNSTGPLWIGGDTSGNYFKGMMDEFRIYNYALTSAQIKKLYKAKK